MPHQMLSTTHSHKKKEKEKFCPQLTSLSDSNKIWSYSESATRKMIEVTFSKQWIHFRRSDRWPPTSTILQVESRFKFPPKQICYRDSQVKYTYRRQKKRKLKEITEQKQAWMIFFFFSFFRKLLLYMTSH